MAQKAWPMCRTWQGAAFFGQGTKVICFFQLKIDPETNALVWNEMLDLDPDSLYL